jgi:hypothetical protein
MSILEVSPRDYHSRLGLDRSNIKSPESWLSKSRLWELKSSSLYKWRYYDKPIKPTAAMSYGTIIDTMITTPDELGEIIAYNPYPDFRTKAAQEFRDSAIAAGKIIVSADEMDRANRAVDALKADPIAGPVIESSAKQVVLLNQIKGINFKGLVDLVPSNSRCLYDLKTTANLTIKGIESATSDFGYHVQAAIYLKLWNLCFPDDKRDRFRFIWQSSEAPHEVAVSELPTSDIEAGAEWASYQIDRLIRATDSGVWPNMFDNKIAVIGRPAWAAYQDEAEIDGVITAPTV